MITLTLPEPIMWLLAALMVAMLVNELCKLGYWIFGLLDARRRKWNGGWH